MDLDDPTVRAIVVAVSFLVAALVVRWLCRRAFSGWLRGRDPETAARQRTAYAVLEKVVIVIVVVIGVWSVLATFDATIALGRALLASSAVIAVFAGAALATPLGNLGAGLIVAFSQPLRLSDRVTVGDATGFVEEIGLVYTVLHTDDNRRVYVPNTQLTSNAIVNRTIRDPRRTVTATLPLPVGVSFARAREVVLAALAELPDADSLELRVGVGDVGEKVVWMNVTLLAPPDTDVPTLASDVRERSLAALGAAGFLPE